MKTFIKLLPRKNGGFRMTKRLISFRDLKAICPDYAQSGSCFHPDVPDGGRGPNHVDCRPETCPRWARLEAPKPPAPQGRQDPKGLTDLEAGVYRQVRENLGLL